MVSEQLIAAVRKKNNGGMMLNMKNSRLAKKLIITLCAITVQIIMLSQIAVAFDGYMNNGMINAETDVETLLLNYIAIELEAMTNSEFGTQISINSDGSVTGLNADGSRTTAGGRWPANKITMQLPYPEEVEFLVYNEGFASFTAVWNTTSKGYKRYVESIESSGFGIYSQEIEAYIDGYELHSYSVASLCGMIVDLTFSDNIATMGVRYPDFLLNNSLF